MQKAMTFLAILTILTGALATGCSESDSRQASETLSQAVTEAQTLLNKGVALLASPPYRIDGQRTPLTRPAAPAEDVKIDPLPDRPVNPAALDTLDDARSRLAAAINDNAAAPERVRAIARQTLGEIEAVIARYHQKIVDAAERDMGRLIERAQGDIGVMGVQARLLEQYDTLIAAPPEAANDLLGRARQRRDELAGQIEARQQRIEELTEQRDALVDRSNELAQKTSEMKTESRFVTGREGLAMLEKALETQSQINDILSQIADREYTIESLRIEVNSLQVAKSQAEALLQTAQSMVGQHDEFVERLTAQREQLAAGMAETRKDLETALSELASTIGSAAEQAAGARSSYDDSTKDLEAAQDLWPDPEPSAVAGSATADVLLTLANFNAGALTTQKRLSALQASLTSLWETLPGAGDLPPGADALGTYADDPQQLRDTAADQYTRAAELYEQVQRRVDRDVRWVYQGQQAAAWVGLYGLTGDAEARSKARAALDEALSGDQADSPYLEPVRELDRRLSAAG